MSGLKTNDLVHLSIDKRAIVCQHNKNKKKEKKGPYILNDLVNCHSVRLK